MRFDKIMINNNNDNNNDNQKEEFKNNQNKDIIEPLPEKNNDIKSPDVDTDKKKFDDRLLDSQALEPEKIQRIIMDEICSQDDFNFGKEEVVNPYETNDNNNNDKKR